MYARSSSTVLFCVPTSPISPPTEIVTPFGSSSRTVLQNVDADFVVQSLLLVERRLREVDERRRVDVDVVEARGDRLAGERLHGVDFGRRVGRVLLGVHLEVIALNEHRSAKSFAHRRREHHRDVLRRPLQLGKRIMPVRDIIERIEGLLG